MTTEPLVTFVVPCYKLAHLLSQCVSSVLKQNYRNFEILIMDNCSPDNTPQVAQSFNDPRVQHIRNESNLGHIRNYNKGLTFARGKYVWLLSADDILRSPHVLGRFVEVMERNPRVGYVFCRAIELNQGKEKGIVGWADLGDENRIWKETSFLTQLIRYNCIVAPTVLMRKECHEKVGQFQVDLPYASDWYMWCMLAMHYGVAYLSDPMVCYRVHEESLTSLYSGGEYARICVGDELSVLWRVGRDAELAHIPSVRIACDSAFTDRAFRLLRAPLYAASPCMNVSQFEEILQSRFRDVEGIRDLRAAVYARLEEAIARRIDRDSAPISPAAELRILWMMGYQAGLASVSSLRAKCEILFFSRAVGLLKAGSEGTTPSISRAEFETILQTGKGTLGRSTQMRATVYTTLGDKQYRDGAYTHAAESYRLALSAHPWELKTWAKYLLLHTGGVGNWIRQHAR
jgi:glycosyltransferase involved in cell wall biosynthesis